MSTYRWIESVVPEGLGVRQVYGFIFNLDGRILLLKDEGKYNLPGGNPQHGENLFETLAREAKEEVQVTISSSEYLGYQLIADDEEFAQVRLACLVDEIFPSRVDPSTGRMYSRHWIPPIQANKWLGWGDSGDRQIESAIKVASKLGVTWN